MKIVCPSSSVEIPKNQAKKHFCLRDSLSADLAIVPMEVQEKLFKFRYHFLGALLFCLTIFSLTIMAPRFLTLLAYFWPLFLSTALVFALVFFIARTSHLPPSDATSLYSAGQGLLDYVDGHHDLPSDTRHKSD